MDDSLKVTIYNIFKETEPAGLHKNALLDFNETWMGPGPEQAPLTFYVDPDCFFCFSLFTLRERLFFLKNVFMNFSINNAWTLI